MFDFRKLAEVVTEFGKVNLEKAGKDGGKKRREFVEITKETKLSDLNRFFEWNSAAVVTERVGEGKGAELRAVAVVTKVDLLTWLVKNGIKQ